MQYAKQYNATLCVKLLSLLFYIIINNLKILLNNLKNTAKQSYNPILGKSDY